MLRFSANLGFLWQELSLPNAIRAAHRAGFDAVECHWPYAENVHEVQAAIAETGLPMIGINTVRGDASKGEFGLAALGCRQADARAAIDEALEWAATLDCPNIHVMAGTTIDRKSADNVFVENLVFACEQAATNGQTILIEPINRNDAPDYHLADLMHALDIINEVDASNLKIMFDCYHVAHIHGDVLNWFKKVQPHIGHIQFAGVPDRAEPNLGTVDYSHLLPEIQRQGYDGFFGAEYRPRGSTQEGLGWLGAFANGGVS